jgi:hypothetical protein
MRGVGWGGGLELFCGCGHEPNTASYFMARLMNTKVLPVVIIRLYLTLKIIF